MIDLKIVTPDDIGEGIEFNPETKKFDVQFPSAWGIEFSDEYMTVGIMGDGVQIMLRKIKGTELTVATGVHVWGTWYGDAPAGTEPERSFRT